MDLHKNIQDELARIEDIEFDFPDDERRYRRQKALEFIKSNLYEIVEQMLPGASEHELDLMSLQVARDLVEQQLGRLESKMLAQMLAQQFKSRGGSDPTFLKKM